MWAKCQGMKLVTGCSCLFKLIFSSQVCHRSCWLLCCVFPSLSTSPSTSQGGEFGTLACNMDMLSLTRVAPPPSDESDVPLHSPPSWQASCLPSFFRLVSQSFCQDPDNRWICLKSIEFGRRSEDFLKSSEFVRKLRKSEVLKSLLLLITKGQQKVMKINSMPKVRITFLNLG